MATNCEICDQAAHGNHFGVFTCRACAAFFRRAGANPRRTKNVHCVQGPCKIYRQGVFKCKKCRLKKCLDKGMDAKKFKLNHDLVSSTSIVRTSSLAGFLGRPSFLLFCEPSSSHRNKTIVDFGALIEKAIHLMQCSKPYSPGLNSLQKLSMCSKPSKEPRQLLGSVRKEHTLMFWEQELLSTAEWFADFDEFRRIPFSLQLEIIKSIWMTRGKLEKLAKTAEFQTRAAGENEKMYFVGDDFYMDVEAADVDVTWFTDYSRHDIEYFLTFYHNPIYVQIVRELISLAPSRVELTFMFLQLCLQQAAKKLGHSSTIAVSETTDRLEEAISDQLHVYYHTEHRLANYSSRVARMQKINNLMRKDMWDRGEKQRIADVFGIFSVDFSHPNMMLTSE